MSQIDRLSALISRFELQVVASDPGDANLLLCGLNEQLMPSQLVFSANSVCKPCKEVNTEFAASVQWGGASNPLLAAMPQQINLKLDDDREMSLLAQLLIAESRNPRCGSGAVLSKLGEVLMVRLLRIQLSSGLANTGLLGGLADDRLARAIVAVHEEPGRHWSNAELADTAGLSMSRFVELFGQKTGQTPMSYLRHWRMLLARQDVERGERIQRVAHRYGYASGEALTRAFRREHQLKPTDIRRQAMG